MAVTAEVDKLYNLRFDIRNFNVESCHAVVDGDFTPVNSDEQYRRFVGIKAAGGNFIDCVVDGKNIKKTIKKIKSGETAHIFTDMIRCDGSKRHVMLAVKNIDENDENGSYDIRITDIVIADKMLMEKNMQVVCYSHLLEMENHCFFDYDFETDIISIFHIENKNPVFVSMMSFEVWAKDTMTIENLSDNDKETFEDFVNSVKSGDNFFQYDFESNVFTGDLNDKNISIKCNSVLYENKIIKTMGIIYHKDTSKDSDSALINIDKLDIFTGLYNKKTILNIAKKMVEGKQYETVHLVMLDLDNFKLVNDNYGHMKGDEVIKRISIIIKDIVGNRGYVGRFGGDEYFAVLYNVGSEGDLRAILETIQSSICKSYEDEFENFNLSASIGVSQYPANSSDFDILFKKADKAVYIAKKKGKKRYILYKEYLHGELESDNDEIKNESQMDISVFVGNDQIFRVVNDVMKKLMTYGIAAIEECLYMLIDTYRLSGISIYRGKEYKCVFRAGTYVSPIDSITYLENEKAIRKFNKKYFLRENNVKYSYNFIPEIHNLLTQHSIGATVQCIMGTYSNIEGLMTFDVQQTERRWSEEECQFFTLIAQCINIIYNKEARKN